MIEWWQRQTIRFRLTVWYMAMSTLLIIAFSTTLYFFVEYRASRSVFDDLHSDLSGVRSRLVARSDGSVTWDQLSVPPGASWDWNKPWIELWDDRGRLVRRLWPFTEDEVEQFPGPPTSGREAISVFRIAKNIHLQAISGPFPAPGGGAPWTLRVMQIEEPSDDLLGKFHTIMVVALPTAIILLLIGGYSSTRRWLRPLQEMVKQTGRITVHDLSQRLTIANPHDEVGHLASVFNSTLDRLQNSFSSLDRFVADASHELRTPLTTLRSVGENGMKSGRSAEEYRDVIGSMLEEAGRLQILVERLLELASVEGGRQSVHFSSVQLDRCTRECVEELRILAESKNQNVILTAGKCTARTDPVLYRQSLQNLLDNAIKYSPAGTTIQVTVEESEGVCRVAVTDEGPGISPEDQRHIAERFFRADGSRQRTSGGFGLGLAITKAYVRMLGGSLDYKAVVPHGSAFLLTLPMTSIPSAT